MYLCANSPTEISLGDCSQMISSPATLPRYQPRLRSPNRLHVLVASPRLGKEGSAVSPRLGSLTS
ncbi:hypothetical protein BD309DRAFT_944746 [Dichomitus squalens]|nr:hypothetical protein BD309DRAFT_944746 [Dichomitus squalens]